MWLWVGIAGAQQSEVLLDGDDLERMIVDLLPVVAEHAGRTPSAPLRSGILTRERLRLALAASPPGMRGVAVPQDPLSDEQNEQLVRDAVAVYVPDLHGVYLVKEAFEELMQEAAIEPGRVRPVVRCLVAHELVHALQHQYGAPLDDRQRDRFQGRLAVEEGHATLVGLEVCEATEGPTVAAMVEAVQGVDIAGTIHPDDPAARYAYGRELVRRLVAEDRELVWSALAGAPPTWSAVAADLRPILGQGWQEPGPVVAAAEALGMGAAELAPASLRTLAPFFGDALWSMPRVSAGWLVQADDERSVLAAFRLEETGAAADLVGLRERWLEAPEGILLAVEVPGFFTALRSSAVGWLSGEPRVAGSLRMKMTTDQDQRYFEHWLASDRVVVVYAGRRPPGSARQREEQLLILLDVLSGGSALPGVRTSSAPSAPARAEEATDRQGAEFVDLPALAPWLDRVRERRSELVAVTTPEFRLHLAAWGIDHGEPTPCVAAFDDVLTPGALARPEPWALAAYRCAAMARDLATAERAAALLDQLEPGPAAAHAWTLLADDRVKDAFAVLERAGPAEGQDATWLADARLGALAQSGRWAELAEDARSTVPSPELRAQAADALWSAGLVRQAKEILREACPAAEPLPDACAARSWR